MTSLIVVAVCPKETHCTGARRSEDKRDHLRDHADAEIEDQRRLALEDRVGELFHLRQELAGRDRQALVEQIGDRRVRQDRDGSRRRHGSARAKRRRRANACGGPRGRRGNSRRRRRSSGARARARHRSGRHFRAAIVEAGAAHLPHQVRLDGVLPRRHRVAAMHVDLGQARERQAAELDGAEPPGQPFEELLAEFEGARPEHIARADIVEERQRRADAADLPVVLQVCAGCASSSNAG